ncbi:MAG: formyltransferase family protein [Gemmatimonadota bacterium]
MAEGTGGVDGSIGVVMFGSGPVLTPDARRFLLRLEAEPGIELLAAFCQAGSSSLRAVFADLVRRRGILAVPLFGMFLGRGAWGFLRRPRATLQERRGFRRLSDRVFLVPDIHDQAVLDRVRRLAPELGLVYGSPILRPELFEIPRLGTLGIHHGKVPEYRGNKTTFWAMWAGERTAGVTIQKINAGLDTGEIVKEGEVVIGRRSLGSVWRELETLGIELYVEAIQEVRDGVAKPRPQTGEGGPLYRNPKPADLLRFHGGWLLRRLRGRGFAEP